MIVSRVIDLIIVFYQRFLSPIALGLGFRCRFSPSCSEYARDALKTMPIRRAILAIGRRLLSCSAWTDVEDHRRST